MSISDALPMFVDAETGATGTPPTQEEVTRLGVLVEPAKTRAAGQSVLGLDATIRDSSDFSQTGWGVLFASDVTEAIKAKLKPLLDRRRQQAGGEDADPDDPVPSLYQEFTVPDGISAWDWAVARKISLEASVRPWLGVPYYLLIVGSPEKITFEFQALLKMQFAVGRLYFDDVDDYGRYAEAVVAYETAAAPATTRTAAVWMTAIAGDSATQRLSGTMGDDFRVVRHELGRSSSFAAQCFLAEKATHAQLGAVLAGGLDGGRPAVIFLGTHGVRASAADPAQTAKQGALITQEWKQQAPVAYGTNAFCAADLPASVRLDGAMVMMFACYGCGTPRNDSYRVNADGSPIPAANVNLIASLPQRMLAQGALAVLGHVDMAFSSSFCNEDGTPQPQVLRTPLELLMQGLPVGASADGLTQHWTQAAGQLQLLPVPASDASADQEDACADRKSHYVTTGVDARNYIVLGDPAVKLRVAEMR